MVTGEQIKDVITRIQALEKYLNIETGEVFIEGLVKRESKKTVRILRGDNGKWKNHIVILFSDSREMSPGVEVTLYTKEDHPEYYI
jgi:uncharacterized protein YceH (UPF0502 family)